MADLADIADVTSRWRAPTGQALINATTWLKDASAKLRVRVPGVDEKVVDDPVFADMVREAVAMAVVRMLRGADPRTVENDSAVYISKADVDALLAYLHGTAGQPGPLPRGSFPLPVPYPDPAQYGYSSGRC